MGGGAAGNTIQRPAIQDQRLQTRVCDKIGPENDSKTEVKIGKQTMSFFNANWPQWQLDQLCARKTTPVDLRSYSFAREGIVVFSR